MGTQFFVTPTTSLAVINLNTNSQSPIQVPNQNNPIESTSFSGSQSVLTSISVSKLSVQYDINDGIVSSQTNTNLSSSSILTVKALD